MQPEQACRNGRFSADSQRVKMGSLRSARRCRPQATTLSLRPVMPPPYATNQDRNPGLCGASGENPGRKLAPFCHRSITQALLPAKKTLALISIGNKSAIATRGEWFYQGASMWRLKDTIDRRFLKKYSELPQMPVELNIAPGLLDQQAQTKLRNHAMRCAGCGQKSPAAYWKKCSASYPNSKGTM